MSAQVSHSSSLCLAEQAGGHAVVANHKVFLANLARKKALEREAAARQEARSDRPHKQRLEEGFQCFFNGAHREIGPGKTKCGVLAQPRRSGGRASSREAAMHGLVQPRCTDKRSLLAEAQAGEDLPDGCTLGARSTRRKWETGKVFGLKILEGEDKGATLLYDYTGRQQQRDVLQHERVRKCPGQDHQHQAVLI